MSREKTLTRRNFLATGSTVFLGGIAGCNTSPGTGGDQATPTPTRTRTTTEDTGTSTPDSSPPAIEAAEVSYLEPGRLGLRLAGRDPRGLSRAEILQLGDIDNRIERELEGETEIDIAGELDDNTGDPRVAEIQFLLEDRAGNETITERAACHTGERFGAGLRKDLDPTTYGGDPYLGVTEPEPVETEDGDLYVFWRNTDDEISLSVSPNGKQLHDLGVVASRDEAGGIYRNYVISPSHIEVDGIHYLFFEGNDGGHHESRIGVSTAPSIEGPYTMHDEPVLTQSGHGAEEVLVGTPAVGEYGGDILMFYHGWDAEHDRTSVARVTDFPYGWEKSPENPIIDVQPGTWYSNKVAPSDVIPRGEELYVLVEGDDGDHWRTGLAKTRDPFSGVELVDYNPVLDVGDTGSFDDTHAHVPGAVVTEEELAGATVEWLRLFYQGNDGAAYRMGRASQPLSCTI